jgi:hypothetical protein
MGVANQTTIELKDGNGIPLPVIAIDVGNSNTPVYIFTSIPHDTNGNPLFVKGNAGMVGFDDAIAGSSFNTPNNNVTYVAGQLVANSATAGLVVPLAIPVAATLGGTARVMKARLTKSAATITNALFRAHLYKDTPATISNGDGGTWLTSGALSYLGSFSFDFTGANARAFTDGLKVIAVPDVGTDIVLDTESTSQNIYVLLQAQSAYARVGIETFTLALECRRN